MSDTPRYMTKREILNAARNGQYDHLLKSAKFGNMLSVAKVVVTGLTATAMVDLTAASTKAAATVTGIDLDVGESLPPVAACRTLRVTASGTSNTVGTYILSDASATMVDANASARVGIARISDDGKTLAFPTPITAFTIEYEPMAAVDLGGSFAAVGIGNY